MPRVQVHTCTGPPLTEPRACSQLLTTFSNRLSLKTLLIMFFLSPCCAWPVLIRSGTIRTLSSSPCCQLITLPESFYNLSKSLECYYQSPDIDLPDPRYQLVISDSHSESDHDEATSSSFTPEQLVCIQQLIPAHGTALHGIRPIAAYHHTMTSVSLASAGIWVSQVSFTAKYS